MNILIIGNGFDLANGLPTTYTDFIDFVHKFQNAFPNRNKGEYPNLCEKSKIDKCLKDILNNTYEDTNASSEMPKYRIMKELESLTGDNYWIKHFSKEIEGKGWVDFETEIANVVQEMDNVYSYVKQIERVDGELLLDKIQRSLFEGLGLFPEDQLADKILQKKDSILLDLHKIIRLLEIYLSDFVDNIGIDNRCTDIEQLPAIDKVLSFNYTDIFEQYYLKGLNTEISYIHGKACSKNLIESNNMVLGINEYLSEDKKDSDVNFIGFKKYFQRIHKQTGLQYQEWLDVINGLEMSESSDDLNQNSRNDFHNIYIFGHSLDITDKDILKSFICGKNVHTTIFYTNHDDYGKKIANLVKIIGQNDLIKRTGYGKRKTITFKQIQYS